ncbi:hypothetical protein GCM10027612_56760 [Microbispora bryophytorum subsp. camponoti]
MRVEDAALFQRHRVPLVLGVGELDLISGLKRAVPAKTHAEKASAATDEIRPDGAVPRVVHRKARTDAAAAGKHLAGAVSMLLTMGHVAP